MTTAERGKEEAKQDYRDGKMGKNEDEGLEER